MPAEVLALADCRPSSFPEYPLHIRGLACAYLDDEVDELLRVYDIARKVTIDVETICPAIKRHVRIEITHFRPKS